ncbi:MAG: hypothetical protein ACOC35_13825, partial [Promethearchaeia archaeon]
MRTSYLKIGRRSRDKIKGKKTIIEGSESKMIVKLTITNISDYSFFAITVFDQILKTCALDSFSFKPSIINSKTFNTLIWTINNLRVGEKFSIYYEICDIDSSVNN